MRLIPSLSLAPVGAALLAGVFAVAAPSAVAADYPTKTIKIIVPFGAGGVIDGSARLIAEHLSKRWGQTVLVENKPGASGLIGSEMVAKSPPDGYTILQAGPAIPLHKYVSKDLTWDPMKDLTPVAITAVTYSSLVVHPSVPANTLKEFIAYAKANPNKLNYASLGTGSYTKLNFEYFKKLTDIQMPEIPYTSSSTMILDLLRNDVQVILNSATAVKQQVDAGKLKAIAIQAPRRTSALPNVPTMAEAGLPAFGEGSPLGFMVPAGTPKDIVDKLAKEVQAILALPEVKKQYLEAWDADTNPLTPEQYKKYLEAESVKFGEVAKFAKVVPQ